MSEETMLEAVEEVAVDLTDRPICEACLVEAPAGDGFCDACRPN